MSLPIIDQLSKSFSKPICQKDKKIESLIRKALHAFEMLDQGEETLGIALSGGKDSLTLASMLAYISGKGFAKFKLHAFMVVGPFSCGPAVQVSQAQKLCRDLDIALTLIDSGQNRLTNCYTCSRSRRSLIFRAAKKLAIEKVAFGHHMDDSIETLLMNMLHKAEFCANLPKIHMHKFNITILRPLIYISEKEIIAFAKRHGFLKILCQCPVGARSKRREMKDLIDTIQESYPNARQNLSLLAHKYGDIKAMKP